MSDFGLLAPDRTCRVLRARTADALPGTVAAWAADLGGRPDPVAAYGYLPEVAASRAAGLKAALPDWAACCFALKANGFAPVLQALGQVADGFEVSSRKELAAALLAHRDARPILVSSGPAKSDGLHDALLAAGGTINVESALELHRAAAAGRRAGRRAAVAIRANPASVPVAGDLTMGGTPSPFGVPEEDVPALLHAARSLADDVEVVGIHVHAASNVQDASDYVAYVAWVFEYAGGLAAAHGLDLRLVDVGGGLGFDASDETSFDLGVLAEGLRGLTPPAGARVVFEPGRWIAAACGFYAAPIADVKRSRERDYVVLRGGVNHFLLPASWDLPQPIAVVPVEAWDARLPRPAVRDARVTVAGELCTPEDTLVPDVDGVSARAGDVVVFPHTGAYGWEFGLHEFLGHPVADRVVLPRADVAHPPNVVPHRPPGGPR
jgi:diaminopimelate decarboxylase